MKPKRPSRPRRISEILGERFHVLGWERKMKEQELLRRWEQLVGPRIARHAWPRSLSKGRLTVVTESPVWAQQLALLRRELLKLLNPRGAPGLVQDLYFVTGSLERRTEEISGSPPKTPLDGEQRKRIAALASSIPDAELREAFSRLLEASHRAGKSR